MTPDEFRRFGAEMVEWIARYQERVESFPVRAAVEPGALRSTLPEKPPDEGEPFPAWMEDVEQTIMPGITHWQSPNFFAYFPCNASGPAILGEMLSAGLNVQGMLWSTGPSCTELEQHVLDWLVDMMALPAFFKSSSTGGGVIQDSASSATFCALVAARVRAGSRIGALHDGAADLRLFTAYTSTEAHSSVEKGLRMAGIPTTNLRKVPVDAKRAMDPERLRELVEADRAAGMIPFFVSATVGTTSSNAMDPLDRIADALPGKDIWLHVDAAMSGTAAICPEFRFIHNGLQAADSYCFNPHKWMFTNFDCDCLYVRERRDLIGAFSIHPEYLRDEHSDESRVTDFRDWQIPLGRRFRALKLWFVIRHYGVEGLRAHIRRHVELARLFTSWVEADPDFELLADVPLNLVCFAHRKGNAYTESLLAAANNTGRLFASHTVLDGRYAIRMSIGQTWTEERHIRNAWAIFKETAENLSNPGSDMRNVCQILLLILFCTGLTAVVRPPLRTRAG